MVVTLAIGAVLGGRLGYVVFYRPSLFLEFSSSVPWWGVLRVNEGGMASHGGMIGFIVASFLVARAIRRSPEGLDPPQELSLKQRWLHVLDMGALVSPFGLFLGRMANFVNGELLGKIIAQPGEPSPWWSVQYPQEVLTEHDDQVVRSEEQWSQLVQAVEPYAREGDTFYGVYERGLSAIQSGAPDLVEKLEPLISARHPSQLYQAAAEGLVLGAVLWWFTRKPRFPGLTACAFLITYGILRIITEIWRLPDGHLETPRMLGLSRGQWLSAVMVLAGIVMLWLVLRRPGPRLGGWLTKPISSSNA